VNQTLFTTLLHPLEAIIASKSEIIDQQSNSEKLFFQDFVKKLLFGYLHQTTSLRNLSLELQTNQMCRDLGLQYTPFSTLKDGFSRFDSSHFKELFESALARVNLSTVKQLDEMGDLRVIDGSLFPTLVQMGWTNYRKTKNAFKLHLCFELNRMIPTEFWVGKGNSSEREFLASVLEKGCTYIADRGYFSFAIVAKVLQAEAFFVFRGKANLLYEVVEKLPFNPTAVPGCFSQVRDEIVVFRNDEQQHRLRMISFTIAGSYFRLLTNRFDVSTLNVIILYAYRWQIELFFKFIKRTLKGLHLLNHSRNGVEIQFYLIMTLAVLMLCLKQKCQAQGQARVKKAGGRRKVSEESVPGSESPPEWIKNIAKVFYKSWKISKDWLVILKNCLHQVMDSQLINLLNSA
jgi:hypothetical protein